MKLQIEPKQHIIVGGKDYVADAKGTVEVPDEHAVAEGHAAPPAKVEKPDKPVPPDKVEKPDKPSSAAKGGKPAKPSTPSTAASEGKE